MLLIIELDKEVADEINKELGAETIRIHPCFRDKLDTIPEVILNSSCMVVLSAETDSKTMILRNGKAFILDSDRFYKIVKV